MIVDIALSNNFSAENLRTTPEESVCAVIDVIRATSTIAAVFGSGAGRVIAASSMEQAFALKKIFNGSMLCGEKGGLPPAGFDCGNSPLEFSVMELAGKTVILKTTNGTASFMKAGGSCCIFSLSLLNFRITMEAVLESACSMDKNILLVCSGVEGKPAYDDCYTAGLAVRFLLQRPVRMEFSDSAKLVLSCALSERSTKDALLKSSSAAALKDIGLLDDVAFCSRVNDYNIAVKAEKKSIPDIPGAVPYKPGGLTGSDISGLKGWTRQRNISVPITGKNMTGPAREKNASGAEEGRSQKNGREAQDVFLFRKFTQPGSC